jgi:muramoyltetrapeptide carboxypeptidase
VGVAALSGPVDTEGLAGGVQVLRELGFEPLLAANLGRRAGLFAGEDDERLEGFHRLVADESVKAIFFARGGHGILRLLPHIDWDLVASRPRAYVGYSDLTPLLYQVVQRVGIAAFHGPMVAVDLARGLEPVEVRFLLDSLAGHPLPATVLGGWGERVEGPLFGGCLSLLTATLGTPFSCDPGTGVLFWEDVGEPLYRLDRMLTQLRLSGSLSAIKGMIVGRLEPVEPDPEEGTLPEILRQISEELGCSVVYGLQSGHCQPNLTLPLGIRVRLDPRRNRLEFLS